MKFFSFIFLSFSILLSACHIGSKKVRGSGSIKTEDRSVSSFVNVDVSGNFDVYVKQDSASSVKVVADDNLMEYIEIENRGETLVIKSRDGFNLKGSDEIKVYVSSPYFRKLSASGACDINSESLLSGTDAVDISLSGASDVDLEVDAPNVKADLSGAGTIKLRGKTKDFAVNGSGSVKVRCMELLAENVDVEISGAGNADVFASVSLDVRVSGAGDVNYKGNPTVTKSISGAGSVTKTD